MMFISKVIEKAHKRRLGVLPGKENQTIEANDRPYNEAGGQRVDKRLELSPRSKATTSRARATLSGSGGGYKTSAGIIGVSDSKGGVCGGELGYE